MKTTERRRLKDAGLVAAKVANVEGYVPTAFGEVVRATIEASRPDVERIMALPPIDRRKLPHPPGSKPRGRPRTRPRKTTNQETEMTREEVDRLAPLIVDFVNAECTRHLTDEEYSFDKARVERDAAAVSEAKGKLLAALGLPDNSNVLD